MLTKYYLHTPGSDYELQPDDLANWDEIRCSYKRADYDGVVRSFTSQFEFTCKAYDILRALYLRDRFSAQASISVHTINDRWEYDKQFECPLDFSSIEWQTYTCKLNCLDGGLAAIIKAKKGTKYEMIVGEEIESDETYNLERLPMQESVTYEFTQGENFEDCGDIVVTFVGNELPFMGTVNSEITVGGTVYFKDDQNPDDEGYCIEALKECYIELEGEIAWRKDSVGQNDNGITVNPYVKRVSSIVDKVETQSFLDATANYHYFGTLSHISQLPQDSQLGTVYEIDGIAYCREQLHNGLAWVNSGLPLAEAMTEKRTNSRTYHLMPGDKIVITAQTSLGGQQIIRFISSKFTFKWMGTGDSYNVPVLTPHTVGKSILRKMVEQDDVNLFIELSDHDPRLANTYILAAESIRDLPVARFYSSFTEFADWMSTVFGYVYTIEEPTEPKVTKMVRFGRVLYTPYDLTEEYYGGEVDESRICYNSYRKRFFYAASDGKYYTSWLGSYNYNHPGYQRPLEDTAYYETKTQKLWHFTGTLPQTGEKEKMYLEPEILDIPVDRIGFKEQTVRFLHRSEVLNPNAEIHPIAMAKDVKYSVESAKIYSTITIGYEKKDYEGVNGRDEFNFNNTYSTGCSVSDKTLTMQSKYRADCYGMEFTAQKRGADSTDSTSDNNVFFIHTTRTSDGRLIADRSIPITGTISDKVFNAAFSPMECARANAGLLCLQADTLNLTFASSAGNSDIQIGDEKMSDNLTLSDPLATCGQIEFSSDEINPPKDLNQLIEVAHDGFIYRGFLKEVDYKYARQEATSYKLIVKEVEQC